MVVRMEALGPISFAQSSLAQHHPPVRMNLWPLCNRPFEYPRTAWFKGSTVTAKFDRRNSFFRMIFKS
jgi:hypothetical protein